MSGSLHYLVAVLMIGLTMGAVIPEAISAERFEIRRAEAEPAAGLVEATVEGEDKKVYLHAKAELTEKDVEAVRAIVDNAEQPAIEVTFTAGGAKQIATVTDEHLNKPFAILVEGKVICAPIIRGTIGGKAVITGRFSEKRVAEIVKAMQSK